MYGGPEVQNASAEHGSIMSEHVGTDYQHGSLLIEQAHVPNLLAEVKADLLFVFCYLPFIFKHSPNENVCFTKSVGCRVFF